HLTSIYGGLGRKSECMTACRRCLQVIERHLQLHPDDARALYLGAVVWGQIGERDKALDWAGRALAIDPEEPVTLYNVACMYPLLLAQLAAPPVRVQHRQRQRRR